MPNKPQETITVLDDVTATGTIRERFLALRHNLAALEIAHGAITGTFTLWSSEEHDPSTDSDSDWSEVPTSEVDISDPEGSAGRIRVPPMSVVGHRWLMLKYVHSSGSGNITAKVTLKR